MSAFKSILESWKTSVAGIVGLIFAALAVIRDGAAAMNDPTWQSVVAVSIGLLAARDNDKSEKNDKGDENGKSQN